MAPPRRYEDDLDYSRFADPDPDNASKIEKSEGATGPSWQAKPQQSKVMVVLFLLIAVLVVAGTIIGYLSWINRPLEAFLITVPIEEYNFSWQVNPWASDDSKLLATCFNRGALTGGNGLATVAQEYQDAQKFRQLLNWIAGDVNSPDSTLKGDLSARPLVLHISALAATHKDIPYIVPRDGLRNPEQSEWIKVEDVLEAMNKCRASKRFLLLDVSHPIHDAFAGPLRNDAAEKIHLLLTKWQDEKKLKYPVLVSTGAKQFSWPSDGDQCSAFAYYIAEAMRGGADGYNDNNSLDNMVSVRELVKFVTARVTRFAHSMYDEVNQTPTSYGMNTDAAEFVLTLEGQVPQFKYEPREAYPELLTLWWAVRQSNPDHLQYHSMRSQKLAAGLVRSEEYWQRAGETAYSRPNKPHGFAVDYWWEKMPPGAPLTNPYESLSRRLLDQAAGYRLAVATRGQKEPPADPYLNTLLAKDPKQEDLDKTKEGWDEKVRSTPIVAAQTLWDRARRTPSWTPKTIKTWSELAQQVQAPGAGFNGYNSIELIILKRFGNWNITRKRGLEMFPSREVQLILNVEQELSELLKVGPEGFAIVKDQLLKAEEERRAVYDQYFSVGSGPISVEDSLRKIVVEYKKAAVLLDKWKKANQALRLLTGAIMDSMPGVLNNLDPPIAPWREAITTAIQLSDRLAEAQNQGRFEPSSVEELVNSVPNMVPVLRLNLSEENVRRIVKDNQPLDKPKKLATILRLIVNTSGHYNTRQHVLEESRKASRAMAEKIHAIDEAESKARKITVPDPPKTTVSEDSNVIRRADVVAELLRLAGFEGSDKFEEVVTNVRAKASSTDAVESFALSSNQVWFKFLHDQALQEFNKAKPSNGKVQGGQYYRTLRILRALPGEVLRNPSGNLWDAEIPAQEKLVELDSAAYCDFLKLIVSNDQAIRLGDEPPDLESNPFFTNRLDAISREGSK